MVNASKKLKKKLNKTIAKHWLYGLKQIHEARKNEDKWLKSKILKVKDKPNRRLAVWVRLDFKLEHSLSTTMILNPTSLLPEESKEKVVQQQEHNIAPKPHAVLETNSPPPENEETEIPSQAQVLQEEKWERLQQELNMLKRENEEWHDLLRAYEQEVAQKDEEIQALKQKLQHLNSLNYQQEKMSKNKRNHSDNHANAVLQYGKERDLYDDEILSFLRRSMEYTLKNQTHENSRYRHIMEDLLNANPLPNDLRAEKEKALHQAMKTYTRMDNPTRQALINIGFSITEEGTHYKLVFMKDGRYTCSTSKTSSDIRGGRNFVRDVANLLF